MIKIDNSVPDSEECELFGPDDKKVGDIKNIYGLMRARAEIKKSQLEGYWVLWKDTKTGAHIRLDFDKNARIESWPKGFADFIDDYLGQLILWD